MVLLSGVVCNLTERLVVTEIPLVFCIKKLTNKSYLNKSVSANPHISQSQWPRCLRSRSTAARRLRSWV